MNRFRLIRLTSLVFLVSLGLPGRSAAPEEAAAPPLPTPEMQRLSKLYVGSWTYTETYPKSPFAPAGGVNTGIYSSELGPGGNSVINHFHSKGPVGDFEGVLVVTWDAREKAYKAYVFADSIAGAVVETGNWEDDALTLRFDLAIGGAKVSLRNATRFLEGGKLTTDEYSSTNGGPEIQLVHVEATRK
jgi:hypothetical protein